MAPDRYRDAIPSAAFLSFRLGGTDGVAVETEKWRRAMESLGFDTVTVAGAGPVDHVLPGLAIGADAPPTRSELQDVLASADLVVVENLCSLPLNPGAADLTADVLHHRPALLHHHDLPWQRAQFASAPPPPTDPRWAHVTINNLSRSELSTHGIRATTIFNAFATSAPGEVSDRRGAGHDVVRRRQVRARLGVEDGQRLVMQPTRAIPRKNVAGGIGVATDLDATYWLVGPAEDGFGPELEVLLSSARCPVNHGPPPDIRDFTIDDAYLASDVVALPSTWEGFGNPTIESVIHRRPLAIGPYPVAAELARFGFRWFGLDRTDQLAAWLAVPDPALLDHNESVADANFSLRDLPERIDSVLPDL